MIINIYKELTFQFKDCYKYVPLVNKIKKAWKQLKTRGIYAEGKTTTSLKREAKIQIYE